MNGLMKKAPTGKIARVRVTSEFQREAVLGCPFCIMRASEAIQNDYDIVIEIVGLNWRALKYASTALKNNREIVATAVENDARALWYASNELQGTLPVDQEERLRCFSRSRSPSFGSGDEMGEELGGDYAE